MTYVALKRLRFGEEHLMPGEELPVEPGRNYGLLLRQGLVADLDQVAASEEDHAKQVEGYKTRISALEGQLAEARQEIGALRQEPEPTLGELTKAQLLERAVEAEIEVPSQANKQDIIDLLSEPAAGA